MGSEDYPAAGRGPGEDQRMLELMDVLCARLCHDLGNPIGTLIGALEMAAEEAGPPDPTGRGEALALAGDTATVLGQRLRLLRAAWSGSEGEMDVRALHDMAAGLPGRHRLVLDLSGLERRASFAPAPGRLVLNVLLLAAEALPNGGSVILSGDPGGEMVAMIEGRGAAWAPGFAACLADSSHIAQHFATARRMQGPLTALIAKSNGLGLKFLMGPPGVPPPLLLTLSASP
jgi:histidine phosphotransferase ChpT